MAFQGLTPLATNPGSSGAGTRSTENDRNTESNRNTENDRNTQNGRNTGTTYNAH